MSKGQWRKKTATRTPTKIKVFELWSIGATKKLQAMTTMEAYSAEEAEVKAKRLCKAMTWQYSHIQES